MPTYLRVWSLGLFSSIFFLHIHKQKKIKKILVIFLPDREASLPRKEYCRCGPHPLQVTSPRARPPLVKGAGLIGPPSRNSRAGHSGLWPPLHCGDSKHLHRRLFQAPHCTLRLSHPSVGGNARGPEIVSQLDMQELGLGDHCWPTAHGLLGRRHPGPRLSHMAG